MTYKPIIIGHRGAAGHEPENTLRSFRKAIEFGVDYVECDVWLVDGELVIFHDRELERCSNGRGLVSETSLKMLRALDAGEGERIPLLPELFDLALGKAKLNIELKGPRTAEAVARLIEAAVVSGRAAYADFLVISFDHQELMNLRAASRHIPIGILYYGVPEALAESGTSLDAFSIHIALDFLCPKLIADAQRRGLKVFVYTVNETRDLPLLEKLGVVGFASDFPDRFVSRIAVS